jgi:outer membrane receptor protein involved in Fe transport
VSASDTSRNVFGTYIDLATKITQNWQIDLSGRYEHYNDVGDTTNGKISTRYDLTPRIAVRGSVSTGFRAPSLAEEYYTNVNVSPASAQGLLAANSAAARLIGAQSLKPEESTNYNVGFVLQPVDNLHLTLDAYQIDIRNRIVLGGTAAGADALAAIEAAGLSVPGVGQLLHQRREYAHARHRSDRHVPHRLRQFWPGGLGSGREPEHDLGARCGEECQRYGRAQCAADRLADHFDAQEQDHYRRHLASRQMGSEPA